MRLGILILLCLLGGFWNYTAYAYDACDYAEPQNLPCDSSLGEMNTFIGGPNWAAFYSYPYVGVTSLSDVTLAWLVGSSTAGIDLVDVWYSNGTHYGSAYSVQDTDLTEWYGDGAYQWLNTDEDYGFTLDFYLSGIDEDYSVQDIGCSNDASIVACAIDPSIYAIAIQATTTSETIEPWRYEYLMTYLNGDTILPPAAFSKSTLYSLTATDVRTDAIVFPTKEKQIYRLWVCNTSNDKFPLAFGLYQDDVLCYTMYIGNGYTANELDTTLVNLGLLSTSTQAVLNIDTVWESEGCDDLGLTDVFPAIKCAFVWAFYPPQSSVDEFYSTLDSILYIYPIGYGKLLYDEVASSTTSTSTAYLDQTIDVGNWFGKSGMATVTVNIVDLTTTEKTTWTDPLVNLMETIMWIVFGIWVLVWSLTRKL